MDTMFSNSNTNAGNIFRAANNSFKQMSVKFDVIREAYDKAAGTTSGKEVFSPQAFSTELKKSSQMTRRYKKNVVFSPAEVSEMTGLASIMQVVSGQDNSRRKTLQREADGDCLSLPLVLLPFPRCSCKRSRGDCVGKFLDGNGSGQEACSCSVKGGTE